MFLVYAAPSALEYIFFFPDEKHYTDAAIQMTENHDYLTPYQANGNPRFKKPIVTYWFITSSYNLFGIGQTSSRIFFWLAGALLVFVVYLMTKSLFNNQNTAMIAAFITAANPLVLLSAGRSIPDILLVLFLTISAWGFLEIMSSEKPKKRFYWMAYMGTALAIETKGIPAVAFAGISILFLLFNPWQKVNFKSLLKPIPIIASILVAVSWFIVMWIEHGAAFWWQFFEDQVGMRMSSKILLTLKNLLVAVAVLLAYFIPWIFMLFCKKNKIKVFWQQQGKETKALLGFIFTWILLIILMSGAVSKFYDRYLLPVIPLMAVSFAYIFQKQGSSFKKIILNVFLILNILILILAISYVLFVSCNALVVVGICIGLIPIVAYFNGYFDTLSGEVLIANAIALLFFNIFILLHPLLLPNIGTQISNKIVQLGNTNHEKIFVYGNIRTAADMRVSSHNTLNVVTMGKKYVSPPEQAKWIVIAPQKKHLLDLKNYDAFIGSQELPQIAVEYLPLCLQKKVKKMRENGEKYLIYKAKK